MAEGIGDKSATDASETINEVLYGENDAWKDQIDESGHNWVAQMSSPPDKRFIGEGTFVGWSGVDLQRDYDDGAGRRALNNVSAVEYFRYRPDFITSAPEEFMRSRYSWQQVNP